MPVFSIIIPSFNRANIIHRPLNAVLSQSFKDYEVIIVDDGSSDNTQSVIDSNFSQKNIKYLFQHNQGVSAARNYGAIHANGRYLIFLDTDDLVEENWLKEFYDSLILENSLMAYCSLKKIKIDGSEEYIDARVPYKKSKAEGFVIPGSWVIQKSLFFDIGMYDVNLKFGENTELKIRIDALNIPISVIDHYNFVYFESKDGGSKNNQNKLDSITYTIKKHLSYFEKNPRIKKLQLQTAAVAAARLGMYKTAYQLFKSALKGNRNNIKLWLQLLISKNPLLSKMVWK
jgi:glycosyltransferase involved in cell wall biosynthesis